MPCSLPPRWALFRILGVLFVLCRLVPSSMAAIYCVKADAPGPAHDGASWQTAYTTVGAALSVAVDGDEVWVAQGTYAEAVSISRSVALYGGFSGDETLREQSRPDANPTVLDGGGTNLQMNSPTYGTSIKPVLDGFTMRNASVSFDNSAPQISRCVLPSIWGYSSYVYVDRAAIIGNRIGSGGLRASGQSVGSFIVQGNLIEGGDMEVHVLGPAGLDVSGNTVLEGDIRLDGDFMGQIVRNVVNHGVLDVFSGSIRSSVLRNTVIGTAQSTAPGISFSGWDGGDVSDNLVYGNAGGGLRVATGYDTTVENNTVVGNGGASSGGIVLASPDVSITQQIYTVRNNIVAFNTSGIVRQSGIATFSCNDVYENTGAAWEGVPDPTGLAGNIAQHPDFVDRAHGDLHLLPGSPCIDEGDDAAVAPGERDLDGYKRLVGAHVDIGCYETQEKLSRVYVSPSGRDTNDGATWATAKQSIEAAVDILQPVGPAREIWVAKGTYTGVPSRPSNTFDQAFTLFGGFDGDETSLAERTVDPAGTVLYTVANPQRFIYVGLDNVRVNSITSWEGSLGATDCILGPVIQGGSSASVSATRTAFVGGISIPASIACAVSLTDCTFSGGTNAIAGNSISVTATRCSFVGCPDAAIRVTYNLGISLASCLFTGNGTAVSAERGAVTLENVTIAGNTVGLSVTGSQLTVTNSIISGNDRGITGSGSTAAGYSCIYGNRIADLDGITLPPGTGNIAADPVFIDPAQGNYRLTPASPCVNAGDDSTVSDGDTDLDDKPRKVGLHVDMGAYEHQGVTAGAAYGWGANGLGQLGTGDLTARSTPAAVLDLSSVTALSAGREHSLAITSDGSLWAWGSNSYGQLGTGTYTNSPVPVRVLTETNTPLTGVVAIAAGGWHSLALTSDGRVWAWGYNGFGQLGTGDIKGQTRATPVTSLGAAKAIAAGNAHSLAVLTDGTVWAWGDNTSGQLGNGGTGTSTLPVQAAGISGAQAVAAGRDHSLARLGNGTLLAWGGNAYGQLGDGSGQNRLTAVPVASLTNITDVSAGVYHSLAVRSDGSLWAWGSNIFGELGKGDRTGSLQPGRVLNVTGAVAADGGQYTSIVRTSDGSVYTFGANDSGQLGTGTAAGYSALPVRVPGLSECFAVAAGNWHMLAAQGGGAAPVAYTMQDVRSALSMAAGLAPVSDGDVIRLDVQSGNPARIDLLDAARILRKVNGLENNP